MNALPFYRREHYRTHSHREQPNGGAVTIDNKRPSRERVHINKSGFDRRSGKQAGGKLTGPKSLMGPDCVKT